MVTSVGTTGIGTTGGSTVTAYATVTRPQLRQKVDNTAFKDRVYVWVMSACDPSTRVVCYTKQYT